jgi:hypothetical protein
VHDGAIVQSASGQQHEALDEALAVGRVLVTGQGPGSAPR